MFNLTQKWNFPSNNYGQIFGIADSGIETFKGTPIKSLAREICQNSLDAGIENGKPVKIEFSTFEIEPKSIPDFSNLEYALEQCLDFWSQQKSDKAKTFFRKALGAIHKPTILCLRISDFNTSGLTGAREEYNSPWSNLIKSSGASDKGGSNGGSFGIGKFAPYACSSIRTVFYSTNDIEGASASQGVSRLTSFKNKKSEITQGTGFYGNDKNSPTYKQYSLNSDTLWYKVLSKALLTQFDCDIEDEAFDTLNFMILAQKLINDPLSDAFAFMTSSFGVAGGDE